MRKFDLWYLLWLIKLLFNDHVLCNSGLLSEIIRYVANLIDQDIGQIVCFDFFVSGWQILGYTYLFDSASFFELFVKRWIKQMLESQMHKAPRPNQLKDVHFFFKRCSSFLQCNLFSWLVAASHLSRQNFVDAETDDAPLIRACQIHRILVLLLTTFLSK